MMIIIIIINRVNLFISKQILSFTIVNWYISVKYYQVTILVQYIFLISDFDHNDFFLSFCFDDDLAIQIIVYANETQI